MKIYSKSFEWLIEQQANYKSKLPKIQDGEAKELAKQGLAMIEAEIERREQQKKSDQQPTGKTGQLPNEIDLDAGLKEIAKQEWPKIKARLDQIESIPVLPSDLQSAQSLLDKWAKEGAIKTVKAPDFVAPDDLINVVLEDAKGNEYTRTGTKAQVRALTRKYFSNVHESWMGKEKKMKTGFKNLLSYVVAWREFDGALPVLRDVLPDYDRYNKGGESKEASEAFKVAQDLYDKIVEILTQ